MYTLSKYIYIQLDSCIQYVYTHVSPGLCVLGTRSRAAEVQVSGDRQVPRLRSECHGGAVAQMAVFPTTKSMVKSDVFLFPGLETIHFYLFW